MGSPLWCDDLTRVGGLTCELCEVFPVSVEGAMLPPSTLSLCTELISDPMSDGLTLVTGSRPLSDEV